MTTQTTPVLGRITEDEQPPIGSVFVFDVAKGQIDPRSQKKATKAQTFEVKLAGVSFAKDSPKTKIKMLLFGNVVDDNPLNRFSISVEHWNEVWAPRIEEVRFPKKESTAEDAENAEGVEVPPEDNRQSAKLVMVRIEDVAVVAGHNARRRFEESALLGLANSITEQGIIEPIILNKVGGELRLVAGERRLRAAKLADEQFVEAKVYDGLSDRQVASMALAENFDRVDLDHIETAHELGKSRDAGATVAEIAAEVHRSTDYVREHLDLLRLAEPVQVLVGLGRLPIKQAAMIARVGDHAKQIELASYTTNLQWHDKQGEWKQAFESDVSDYVQPMSGLREDIARAMLGMVACGWLRIEEEAAQGRYFNTDETPETPISDKGGIADKRRCIGCPDNSASYADQPALFAGINPHGSAKKGHCTNEACYRVKEAAWQKVRDARKKDVEKKLAAKVAKAKAAGLDICADCGRTALRTAAQEEVFGKYEGRTLCLKCTEKARKRAERRDQGGRGESWEAKEKRVRSLKAKFPQTAEQKFAKALYDYGMALAKAIEKHLAEANSIAVNTLDVVLWAEIKGRGGWYSQKDKKLFPSLEELATGHTFSSAALAAIWRKKNGADANQPEVDHYDGEIKNVPLPDEHVAYIDRLEQLAAHWDVKDLPGRPTLEEMERKAVIVTIVKGKRPEALAAIAACEASAVLEYVLLPKVANGIGKIAKWRVKAISARIDELKGASSQEPVACSQEPKAAKPSRVNENGVLTDTERIEVKVASSKKFELFIQVALAPGGRWQRGISVEYSHGRAGFGTSYSPSTRTAGHDSRRDAIVAGLSEIAAILQKKLDDDPEFKAVESDIAKALAAVEARLAEYTAPESGVCRFCGCTQEHACDGGCSWVNAKRTECSACTELVDRIAHGKKPDALNAIEYCDKLGVFVEAGHVGLKGDWRRAAVAKRIGELKKAVASSQ